VDLSEYDLGKVALAVVILLLIPVLLLAAWWLGTQAAGTNVPVQAFPQPSESQNLPTGLPSISQQPVAMPSSEPEWQRPDYSAGVRPAPDPSLTPTPEPTPTPVLVRKEHYPATDLHWFVPLDAEMAPFGFTLLTNNSEDSYVGMFLNLSEYYTNDTKAQQFEEGFLGGFTTTCVFSNGTREFVPGIIQLMAFDSPSLASSKVIYRAKSVVTDLGSAEVGDKSILYRTVQESDPGSGTYYHVKFSRKNVFVSIVLPAIRADGSRLDALAIALLIDSKI